MYSMLKVNDCACVCVCACTMSLVVLERACSSCVTFSHKDKREARRPMEGRDFPRVATASLCSCSRGALLYFGHSSTSVNCDELVSAIKSVKAEDVKQGALAGSGHCWLVPAMACLAGTMPMAIHKIFVNKERSWRCAQR